MWNKCWRQTVEVRVHRWGRGRLPKNPEQHKEDEYPPRRTDVFPDFQTRDFPER